MGHGKERRPRGRGLIRLLLITPRAGHGGVYGRGAHRPLHRRRRGGISRKARQEVRGRPGLEPGPIRRALRRARRLPRRRVRDLLHGARPRRDRLREKGLARAPEDTPRPGGELRRGGPGRGPARWGEGRGKGLRGQPHTHNHPLPQGGALRRLARRLFGR